MKTGAKRRGGFIRRAHGGFTLVELMVSLSIFSLLAVAVYSVFAGGVGTWRRAQAFSATYQTARLVLDRMGRELGRAVRISGSEFQGGPVRVSFLTVRRPAPLPVTTGSEAAKPASTDPAALQAAFPIRRITYEFKEASVLRLDESLLEGLQAAHREPEEMAGPFAGLAFEYASKRDEPDAPWEWHETWKDAETIPPGVKMTLTIGDGRERPVRLTRTVFFLQSVVEKKGDGALR